MTDQAVTAARQHLSLQTAMKRYGTPDRLWFECAYPEWQEQRPSSTFYADFSVADVFGLKAIEDTYRRSFDGWKSDVKMFTEMVAVLNHKIWEWHENGVEEYARLYDRLWKDADAYGSEHFEGGDGEYYYMVLD